MIINPYRTMMTIFLVINLITAWGQSSIDQPKKLSKEFQCVCFCIFENYTPTDILRTEDNFKIALEVNQGRTREMLKAMKHSEKNINTLIEWSLLKEDQDKLRLNFPIINKDQITLLEKVILSQIPQITNVIKTDVYNLKREMQTLGFADITFSFLFSYILNGKIYEELENRNLIHPLNLDSQAHWAGEFWVIDQQKEKTYESSSISYESNSLLVNWSPESFNKLKVFFDHWEMLEKALNEFTTKGRVTSASVNSTFGKYGLFGPDGKLLIPVIDENKNDEIITITNKISKSIVDQLTQLPIETIKNQLGLRDQQQALVILYHEFIWDIIESLIRNDVIMIPELFTNPEDITPKKIAQIFFVIKHKA